MVLKTLAVNELVDMEWKFGVTASSKAVSKVGTCFLQLKLAIRRRRKNSTSTPGVTSDYAAFCRDFLSNKGTGTDEGGDSNDINTNTNTNTTVDAKTANASDDGLQHVLMELTLPQFYEFLQEMQKAGLQCGIGLGGGDTDAQIDTETGADEKRETGGVDNDTAMATETHTAGV